MAKELDELDDFIVKIVKGLRQKIIDCGTDAAKLRSLTNSMQVPSAEFVDGLVSSTFDVPNE